MHLDQGFLDGGSRHRYRSNRALERQAAQLRYPQLHLTGLRLELALIMPISGIDAICRAFIPLRTADPVRFRVELPDDFLHYALSRQIHLP